MAMRAEVPRVWPVYEVVQVDAGPHGPDSSYSDIFWTPILGPTATLMWRRLQHVSSVDPTVLGAELGIREGSKARQTFQRLHNFHAVRIDGDTVYVHRGLSNLRPAQVERLPPRLQALHVVLVEVL